MGEKVNMDKKEDLGLKEVKGYNTMNSGVIFIPKRYVGFWAHVIIKEII